MKDPLIRAQSIIYPSPTRMPNENAYEGHVLKLPNMDSQERRIRTTMPSLFDYDPNRLYK